MPIRFKFRSSSDFDSVELFGAASLPLRDLRSRILAQNLLNLGPDSRLLISDEITGQPMEDEKFEVPDGASVIIKRVPSERSVAPSNVGLSRGGDVGTVDLNTSLFAEDENNFDDFGVDPYPTLEALPESDLDVSNMFFIPEKKDTGVPRLSDVSISEFKAMDKSDLSETASQVFAAEEAVENCDTKCELVENIQENLKPEFVDHKKFKEFAHQVSSAAMSTDLPTELRCFLCDTIYKEAVMIPCCQHSFCEKCIRSALNERGRCPKCLSMKCTVNDLLPNLSLRQAIEHFLEAQSNDVDITMPMYIPDDESGTQAKETSCSITIHQKEPIFHRSPSATGKGFNHIKGESIFEGKGAPSFGNRDNLDKRLTSAPLNILQQAKEDANCSGEVQMNVGVVGSSKFLHKNIQEEEDGSEIFIPPTTNRKGPRTCFRCGSPSHFIRDCPANFNPYTHTGNAAFSRAIPGYAQPYWNGASLPLARPYMYGAPGVIPFDQTIFAVSPYGVPSFVPPMYGGMPMPYGFMRMGVPPSSIVPGQEHAFPPIESLDRQDADGMNKPVAEKRHREAYDDANPKDLSDDSGGSHERKHKYGKKSSWNSSDVDSGRTSKGPPPERHLHSSSFQKYNLSLDEEFHSSVKKSMPLSGRDLEVDPRKPQPDVQGISGNSDHRYRERRKHHHPNHSDRNHEPEARSERNHYESSSRATSSKREKDPSELGRRSDKHHSHSISNSERDLSSDRRNNQKESKVSYSSRHTNLKAKAANERAKSPDRREDPKEISIQYSSRHSKDKTNAADDREKFHSEHHRRSGCKHDNKDPKEDEVGHSSRHSNAKASGEAEKIPTDHERRSRKHYSHRGSNNEKTGGSSDRKNFEGKEDGYSSRHSKEKSEVAGDPRGVGRWEMVAGMDKRDEHYHKRKQYR